MKKAIRLVVIMIASTVLVFYGYMLVSYLASSEMNRQESEKLVLAAVTVNTDFSEADDAGRPVTVPDGPPSVPDDTGNTSLNGETGSQPGSDTTGDTSQNGETGSQPASDTPGSNTPNGGTGSDTSGNTVGNPIETRRSGTPISVNFDVLWQMNEDVIAWLYQENTQINYPVMQSSDNDYYLRRSFDRNYNVYGCLYLDYRCTADYSDNLSVIYGHEAENGSMFGSLLGYKRQEYYDTHKVMYLLTPDGNYRVRVFAGVIVKSDNGLFSVPTSDERLMLRIQDAIENSTFKSDVDVEDIGQILMLSTCTYEFTDARYLVLGTLEKIESE